MIKIENVSKQYGAKKALDNVCFEIKKGEIVGLLGRNGAGKSTLMNIITGVLTATDGTVLIDGHDILEDDLAAKKHLGYLPELPPVYPTMTVREYLNFVYDLKHCSQAREEHIRKVAEQTDVYKVFDRVIKNLSKGYRQRVGMAQALMGSPEILILDEPTVGLDPQQIVEMRQLILSLAKEHTVVFSSHILAEVQNVCSRVIVINNGHIAADDTPEGLSERFLKKRQLQLRVVGREGEIYKALTQVLGVKSVIKQGQLEPDSFDFLLEYDKRDDIRKSVFQKLASMGLVILKMSENELKLEDIFLELTDNGKGLGN